MRHWTNVLFVLGVLWGAAAVQGQPIDQSRGGDSRVDYTRLDRHGPWDDRNYQLTLKDLELLPADDADQLEAIPAFYRVWLRRNFPELRREGPAQYPRSALPAFLLEYGGYLVDGKLYRGAELLDGRWEVILVDGSTEEEHAQRFLEGEVRVTSPVGAAESAVAINPVTPDLVIAGSNGPAGGQRQHFSTDGGETWTQAPPLGGGPCCDPTVGWSSDGTLAYTATLGIPELFFYRSTDAGQSWSAPIQVDTGGGFVDKEFLHVDTHPASPHQDNIYMTWHESNIMRFSRSTDTGFTWSPELIVAGDSGIGSDITTSTAGDVYYFWPAFGTRRILVAKSTDGGLSFGGQIEVAPTNASFIFPVPSFETRQVFIYVSADVDRTGGTFNDSIYAGWSDSTAPPTGVPADNHARIQVAFSRDGGATWTTTTPHETDDAEEVDRYHQWLDVAPDGSVHVIFYDSRRDPSRTSVDIFHSVSLDGAQTWSVPQRVTAEQSPNIVNSFEFGDYNGLDVIGANVIGVWTDNRNETGGGGDSVDIYGAGMPSDVLFLDGFESGDTSAWDGSAEGGGN